MIVTKQKDFNCILDLIDQDPVFIIGCSECATLCHTGGEEEVIAMKDSLENNKIKVTGWIVLDPACHLQNDKRILRKYRKEVNNAKKILVLACGNGVQTVSEIINDALVISGSDTLFLGEIIHTGNFEKRCNLCGDCILDLFDGFCPISRCPKGMLNGPCGGVDHGKCEVSQDIDCIWNIIITRFKERGQLIRLKKIIEPKDWSKSCEMMRNLKDEISK
jgi:ferredoxin